MNLDVHRSPEEFYIMMGRKGILILKNILERLEDKDLNEEEIQFTDNLLRKMGEAYGTDIRS